LSQGFRLIAFENFFGPNYKVRNGLPLAMPASAKLKVSQEVIRLVAVAVMNRLVGAQISTQVFFHDKAVLVNIPIGSGRVMQGSATVGVSMMEVTSAVPRWVKFSSLSETFSARYVGTQAAA
jgi:hypothetical protein